MASGEVVSVPVKMLAAHVIGHGVDGSLDVVGVGMLGDRRVLFVEWEGNECLSRSVVGGHSLLTDAVRVFERRASDVRGPDCGQGRIVCCGWEEGALRVSRSRNPLSFLRCAQWNVRYVG